VQRRKRGSRRSKCLLRLQLSQEPKWPAARWRPAPSISMMVVRVCRLPAKGALKQIDDAPSWRSWYNIECSSFSNLFTTYTHTTRTRTTHKSHCARAAVLALPVAFFPLRHHAASARTFSRRRCYCCCCCCILLFRKRETPFSWDRFNSSSSSATYTASATCGSTANSVLADCTPGREWKQCNRTPQ
jgi:hypothetical protein